MTSSFRTRAFVLVALAVARPAASDDAASDSVDEAPKGDDDGTVGGDSPWVDGPDAPMPPPAPLPSTDAPRRDGAVPEPVVEPPTPPRAAFVPAVVVAPRAPIADRLVTTIDGATLARSGALHLAEPLALLPGIWLTEPQAHAFVPLARGLDHGDTQVTLEGVPLVPRDAFPSFPVVSHFAADDTTRVTLRSGPRIGLGTDGAAGGVLALSVVDEPRELGEELPVHGVVRGGIGGADLDKQLAAKGGGGFGRARLQASGAAFHREDRRRGRGDGTLPFSGGFGGHLALAGDVQIDAATRTFALVRSSREERVPFSSACRADDDGRVADCVQTFDRALDVLIAGFDAERGALGGRASVALRAHGQRASEETEHVGNAITRMERQKDEVWRGGALADARLSFPVVLDVEPELSLGLEVDRDRLSSTYESRSQRFSEAAPRDELLVDETRAARVDGQRVLGRAVFGAALRHPRAEARAILDVGGSDLVVTEPDPRLANGLPTRARSPFLSAEVGFAIHPLDEVSVFAAVVRSERPESLFDRTRGRLALAAGDVALPMTPDAGRFVDHTAELGGALDLAWLDVGLAAYASERSGALVVGYDSIELVEQGPILRAVRGPRRAVLGVDARARYTTALDGLFADASFGAVAIDEPVFFRLTDPFASAPAPGVVRPSGAVEVHYAPSTAIYDFFARVRYAFPYERLSPEEELDPVLCPEQVGTIPTEQCRGVPGYALVDLGASFFPSEHLRVDGTAFNVLDQSWRATKDSIEGHGVGARITATLRY